MTTKIVQSSFMTCACGGFNSRNVIHPKQQKQKKGQEYKMGVSKEDFSSFFLVSLTVMKILIFHRLLVGLYKSGRVKVNANPIRVIVQGVHVSYCDYSKVISSSGGSKTRSLCWEVQFFFEKIFLWRRKLTFPPKIHYFFVKLTFLDPNMVGGGCMASFLMIKSQHANLGQRFVIDHTLLRCPEGTAWRWQSH